jgi:hypothetical protein
MPSNQKEQRESQQIRNQINHLWTQPAPQERGKVSEPMVQEREQEKEQDPGLKKATYLQVWDSNP